MVDDRYSEAGLARVFAEKHGANVIPVKQSEYGYLIWDGDRYTDDSNRSVERMVQAICREYAGDMEILAQNNDKKAAAFAGKCLTSKITKSVLDLFTGANSRHFSEFDQGKELFATRGATVDLQSGESYQPRQSDRCYRLSPVRYDSAATCEQWQRFLAITFESEPENIEAIQRILGYALSNSTKEHKLFILYGTGANGKSTFLETIRHIFGEYSAVIDRKTVFKTSQGSGATPEVARLLGVRFAAMAESPSDAELNEESIKTLTGGDTITARFLHRNPIEFTPKAKIFLACNVRPSVTGTDTGIWRRIYMIPFTRTIPEAERDKELLDKLKAEAPGILNWMLEGYRKWRESGLVTTPSSSVSLDELRDMNDSAKLFLDDMCVQERGARVGLGDLYSAYLTWAKSNCDAPIKTSAFRRRLIELGMKQGRTCNERFWDGIRLRNARDLYGY